MAGVLRYTKAMVLACIDVVIADHLGAMNEMPDGAAVAIREGSRQNMTDGTGVVVTCWGFTCTNAQAMIIRAELCSAAAAVRESNPELFDRLLNAERAIARAMAGG